MVASALRAGNRMLMSGSCTEDRILSLSRGRQARVRLADFGEGDSCGDLDRQNGWVERSHNGK